MAGKIAGFAKGAPGGFRSWFYTITRHKAGDHYRRNRGQPVAAGGSDAQERLQELPEQASDSSSEGEGVSERAILVRRAMELVRPEFQPRTWQAAWRVAVEGQSPVDVAAALGMSAGAVHTAKSRVLARLRELLAELLDDGPDGKGADS